MLLWLALSLPLYKWNVVSFSTSTCSTVQLQNSILHSFFAFVSKTCVYFNLLQKAFGINLTIYFSVLFRKMIFVHFWFGRLIRKSIVHFWLIKDQKWLTYFRVLLYFYFLFLFFSYFFRLPKPYIFLLTLVRLTRFFLSMFSYFLHEMIGLSICLWSAVFSVIY